MQSRVGCIDAHAAWQVIQAAARHAERMAAAGRPEVLAFDSADGLRRARDSDPDAVIAWAPGSGWETVLPRDHPRTALIDLYLPICSATTARPITVGHLGQSLDGFIATHAGESRWVTGEENLLHMHRLRALCDAVVVGSETVAADDPQLTTRRVRGSNPLRIVLDPTRRLNERYRVFSDEAAETWYVCARSSAPAATVTFGRAEVIVVDDAPEGGVDVEALMRLLRQRGRTRVFVEGGGV